MKNKLIIFISCLIVLFDGYDLAIFGFILPNLFVEFDLNYFQASLLGSSSLLGMMIGALTLGQMGGIGLKKILIISVSIFSLFMVLTGFSRNYIDFIILRFCTGIGLGAAIPCLVVYLNNTLETTNKNLMINTVLSFYGIGALLSGLMSYFFIDILGWRTLFFISAFSLFLPLLIFVFFEERIINNKIQAGRKQTRLSINLTQFTYLALIFMCTTMAVYNVYSWLPKTIEMETNDKLLGILFLSILNIGTFFGTILIGKIADISGQYKTLIFSYLIASLAIVSLGSSSSSNTVLYSLLILIGGTTVGCMATIHVFATDIFKNYNTPTIVSILAAFGRVGAILGPLVGGLILSSNFNFSQQFIFFALPTFLAFVLMILIRISSTKLTL